MPSLDTVVDPDGGEHTRYLYSRKAHGDCEYCRRANAEYIARKKAEHFAHTASETARYHAEGGEGGIPSLKHGYAGGHEWYGCTEPCCLTPARARRNKSKNKARFIRLVNQVASTDNKETA